MNGQGAHASALRGFLGLSRPWLLRRRTLAALALLVLLTAVQVLLVVALSFWNARLFDALEGRDAAGLWGAVGIFGALLLAVVVSNAAHLEARRGLALGWRRALTARLLEAWLAEGRQWRLAQLADAPDNPDGRIAEDIRIATEHAVELLATLLYALMLLGAFVGLLWALSGEVSVLGVPVPGHMVWLALLYALAGAAAAFALGRPLAQATEGRQRAEAELRSALVRARDEAEALALARGEAEARGGAQTRFAALGEAWRRQTAGLRNLLGFQSAYTSIAPVLPLLVSAPRYLAGEISLGVLVQIGQGFQQAVSALSWPVDNTARLAEWHASADRLLALAEAAAGAGPEGGIARSAEEGGVAAEGLALCAASGAPLAGPVSFSLPPGALAGLEGPPPATAALLAALAGLWPWGRGRVAGPPPEACALWSRPAWLPEAALARLLDPTGEVPRPALVAALEGVGLGALAPRLDETANWSASLEEPERLRLAFARLLLSRPALVLVGEGLSVLEAEELRRLIALLRAALPRAVVVMAAPAPEGAERIVLAAPEGEALPAARAAQRPPRRAPLIAWLRQGFGHARE
ncbi:SbmA/BacA-like family transporter [Rubritepida flocculans]|uniref:SbmA/BacA-like family transporter n=1 Tax=Rubritepida flocculans TaxID=182403 RepID=UPI0003F96D17|nr:SbmA/BacA-like family transporter [Rubritepida flocculans]